MNDTQLGPLAAFPHWFVPIAPLGDDVLTGSICLPASTPADEVTHPDGRTERIPPPFDVAATVLVFEDYEDAIAYFQAYSQDTTIRAEQLDAEWSKFQIARMSGQQVLDNFKQQSPGTLWHVPTPVHHAWAQQVVETLAQKGLGPSTEVATERLAQYLTAQN